jgi:O-6-methylguanine DNA methyltransferase
MKMPHSKSKINKTKNTFSEKVYDVVRLIPKGKTMTYAEVARKAGSPTAVRAVGNVLNKNYDKKIPCHRVIRSDGKTGGYNRGEFRKIAILKKEGAL